MKSRFSYDRLPYPSKFFVQAFPDRLATNATLFGMSPADPATSRVLELGCGNGSNLIAQAYLWPDASFVGVDLAQVHIDDANSAAAELGLTNVEFRQMDVADMSAADFGTFDYIVAHGLFSWVPEFVRQRVLEIFAELLNPSGVGYLSYSVLPGAYARKPAQDAMRFVSREVSEPEPKVARALSFLKFLAENTAADSTYRALLEDELVRHRTHLAADIFHDDLSELNAPFYFHEFADHLGQHGLQYLSEAELHAMGGGGLPQPARDFIASLDSVIEREQYLDHFRGRAFRQTLFCRKDIDLDRQPAPAVVDNFLVLSSLRAESKHPDLASEKIEKFVGTGGVGIEIDRPLVKAMLVRLGDHWPRAISFLELADQGKSLLSGTSIEPREVEIARTVILQIAMQSRMVELHLFQPDRAVEPGERPAINALARLQMRSAEHVITGLGIDMKIKDAVSRTLLELMDGTRDRRTLAKEMSDFIGSAPDITDRADLLRSLPSWIDDSIANLGRIGMFQA